jgi:hypothetical protein
VILITFQKAATLSLYLNLYHVISPHYEVERGKEGVSTLLLQPCILSQVIHYFISLIILEHHEQINRNA